MVAISAPLFITEIVPAHVRGRSIGLCNTLSSIVSILAVTLVWGTEKIQNHMQFKIPLAGQAALPLVAGCFTFFISESPTWYLFNGRLDQASHVLMQLRARNEQIVAIEIEELKEAVVRQRETQKQTKPWDILFHGNLNRTLMAGAYQPLLLTSGIILVQTYATILLIQSGLIDAFQVTIIIWCLGLLGQVCGVLLIDKVGRRPLVLCGLSALCVLDVIIGSLAATSLESQSQRTALAAMFIVFSFFSAITFDSM